MNQVHEKTLSYHWLQQSRVCVPNQLDCWSGFEFAERQAQGDITVTICLLCCYKTVKTKQKQGHTLDGLCV